MPCNDKQGYSKNQIKGLRERIYKARKNKLRIYECRDCGSWHLTSNIDNLL